MRGSKVLIRISSFALTALITFLLPLAADAKCIDKKSYDSLNAQWIAVNPQKNNIGAARNWPPEGQEVLFYFDEPRLTGPVKGEFTRFRFGYVIRSGCDSILTGRNLNILFPQFQLANYEPTHWMPLTYVTAPRK
jgi:hypothetical protein